MKRIIVILVIFIIAVSSAQSQSLKSISENKELIINDSTYKDSTNSILKNKDEFITEKKKGDYVTFSTGFFVQTKKNSSWNGLIPYTSLDLNISLGSVIYLDLGGDVIFPGDEVNFSGHGTLGVGLDIIPNKLFAHAGVGAVIIVPFIITEIVTLRVNYKFSKDISAGLDNRFIGFGESDRELAYRYTIGLNFSYRFNY